MRGDGGDWQVVRSKRGTGYRQVNRRSVSRGSSRHSEKEFLNRSSDVGYGYAQGSARVKSRRVSSSRVVTGTDLVGNHRYASAGRRSIDGKIKCDSHRLRMTSDNKKGVDCLRGGGAVRVDGKASIFDGDRLVFGDRRLHGVVKGAGSREEAEEGLVSFYFTNVPENMPSFRLRQVFEVCGILTDVYVARKLNARGQVYGFVRFAKVKNSLKLSKALNNVWIGGLRVWAREARYDRFASNGMEGGRPEAERRHEVIGDGIPVIRTRGKGVKNVRVSNEAVELSEEGTNKVQVGSVLVDLGVKNLIKEDVKKDSLILGADEGRGEGLSMERNEMKIENIPGDGTQLVVENKVIVEYKSTPEDLLWASGGMVARVISGESTLSVQQRVEDAGFLDVVVIPMGGDRVFIFCTGEKDVWQVFNDAIDFFSMIFADVVKWSSDDMSYERGAWLRVYGVPVHAWNEIFFRKCVMECGRFIKVDECTAERARLDFARILISTTSLEVINSKAAVLVDDHLYNIKLVEEWGYCMGDDVSLSDSGVVEDEEVGSDDVVNQGLGDDNKDIDVVLGELHKEWMNGGEGTKDDILIPTSSKSVHVNLGHSYSCGREMSVRNSDSNNNVGLSGKGIGNSGGDKDDRVSSTGASRGKLSRRGGVVMNYNAGFLKRIARLPSKDRKEVLKVLRRQARKKRIMAHPSKGESPSVSNASINSSSVNTDWENWVLVHGNKKLAVDDVWGIGKALGVKFNGDKLNSFNVMSKEGRRGLRVELVKEKGMVGDTRDRLMEEGS